MKKFIMILSLIIFYSCTITDEKKPDKPENKEPPAKIGWTGDDTYTVMVTAHDEKEGRKKAVHKILKDIVNVRMFNKSEYTDITKISKEFEKPLENGRIIYSKKLKEGIMIYFQIKDKGLKEKFIRK